MKTVYLDKKDVLRTWILRPRTIFAALSMLAALFAPVWRETVQGRFLLEPARRAVVRAEVPGMVAEIQTEEGARVSAGAPLVRLRDLALESEMSKTEADLRLASAKATSARLSYMNYGPAERERQQLEERFRTLQGQAAHLSLFSPIDGMVVTPRLQDLLGSRVEHGAQMLEVDDLSRMRARIYVLETDLRKLRPGNEAALLLDGLIRARRAPLAAVGPAASEVDEGVDERQQFTGLGAPHHYVATIWVQNPGVLLKDGMTGTAKMFVRRRSIAGFTWRAVSDFVWRKLW